MIPYRTDGFWAMGCWTSCLHFATVSYAFCRRFPEELAAEIFEHILNKALNNHMVDSSMIFIDGTHIKASANKKKYQKEQVAKAARVYAKRLREEVNEERAKLGKPPVEEEEDDGQWMTEGQRNRRYRPPTRNVGCTTRESMKSNLPMSTHGMRSSRHGIRGRGNGGKCS